MFEISSFAMEKNAEQSTLSFENALKDAKTARTADKICEPVQDKPKRCQAEDCFAKLSLTSYACHCGQYFCPTHIAPEHHKCNFDYRTKAKQEIKAANPKMESNKGWTPF